MKCILISMAVYNLHITTAHTFLSCYITDVTSHPVESAEGCCNTQKDGPQAK